MFMVECNEVWIGFHYVTTLKSTVTTVKYYEIHICTAVVDEKETVIIAVNFPEISGLQRDPVKALIFSGFFLPIA